jgi:hypothetical protein
MFIKSLMYHIINLKMLSMLFDLNFNQICVKFSIILKANQV